MAIASSKMGELSIKGSEKKKSDYRDVLFFWFVTLLGLRYRILKRWHNLFFTDHKKKNVCSPPAEYVDNLS